MADPKEPKKAADKKSDSKKVEVEEAVVVEDAAAKEQAPAEADVEAARKEQEKLHKKHQKKQHKSLKTGPWICICIVVLALGILLGKFCFGFLPLGMLQGHATLSDVQLDQVVAQYQGKGGTQSITAREVLENTSGLDSAKDGDDYTYPSADSTIDYIRNRILKDLATQKGISANDDQMNAYAEATLGNSDYDSMATQYGMSVDDIKNMVRDAATVGLLYQDVTGADPNAKAPEAPAETSNKTKATAEYGDYITGLLGDEWDNDNNTWAKTDGSYYEDLKDETFSKDSATYDQAKKAYDIASKNYNQTSKDAANKWDDFVNDAMTNTAVVLSEVLS